MKAQERTYNAFYPTTFVLKITQIMNLLEFFKKFPTEESCKLHYKELRIKQGISCRNCKHQEHYWLKTKEEFECKKCKSRTSLRSGTVMHSSKLPYLYWYATMHLMTSTKKGFSAKELQRQLGHNRYEPIWAMMHKIRVAMGERDERYQLTGTIELDEGFFTNTDSKDSSKTPVLVAAESKAVENPKKYKPKRSVKYLKMEVLENRTKDAIFYEVKKMIDKKATVLTDGLPAYKSLKDIVTIHHRIICEDKKEVSEVFPWVHTAISNFRKILLGIYHGIKSKFMQNYVNEFCYKFNRRYFELNIFDRLMIAVVSP